MRLAHAFKDDRSEVRLTVEIAASIKPYLSPVQNVIIADVSSAGALIRGEFHDLCRGEEVILAVGDAISLVATVAWMQEGSLGLAFHRRMSRFEFDGIMKLDTMPQRTARQSDASASVHRDALPTSAAKNREPRPPTQPSWPRSVS